MAVLEDFNLRLSDGEFAKLQRALGASGDGGVDYAHFLRRFGGGFAARDDGVLGTAAAQSSPRKARGGGGGGAPPLLRAAEAAKLLKQKLREQSKNVQLAFLSCDEDRSGTISAENLKRVLARFSIRMSEVRATGVRREGGAPPRRPRHSPPAAR